MEGLSPLLMLFLSTFILAVDHFKTATVWILVLADVVSYPMGRVYTRIDQIASFWSKWFYDAATIGIFSHRMALLVYPSRAMLHRKLALFIVFAETVVPFLMVGVFQGLNLMNMVRTAGPNGLGQQGNLKNT
ncbi:hypothetical protein L596_019752 [Steinernema carpocapsae]|uniref:Serpentine receptor class gamma n=1 Tax=Steinernema carpocapsae TaxID=34508 RepID=A0A4U5MRP4_STECR|nr:hypothetical protein L596_019752 [Steinernema carpocapsae]